MNRANGLNDNDDIDDDDDNLGDDGDDMASEDDAGDHMNLSKQGSLASI